MKQILLLLLILLTTQTNAQKMNRDIIDVSESYGGFRIVFDDNTSIQCNRYGDCPLVGNNNEFFVVEDSSYFLVLDPSGDVEGRIQKSQGDRVTSVTFNSVVVRKGDYLYVYDMQGNQKTSRQF